MLNQEFPIWESEDFPTCNVCGEILVSDANPTMNVLRYCKLCGMPTQGRNKFCCKTCEHKFKKFVKREERVKK